MATQVYHSSKSGIFDLVYPDDPTEPKEKEEIVASVQGYLLRANLPPVIRRDQ